MLLLTRLHQSKIPVLLILFCYLATPQLQLSPHRLLLFKLNHKSQKQHLFLISNNNNLLSFLLFKILSHKSKITRILKRLLQTFCIKITLTKTNLKWKMRLLENISHKTNQTHFQTILQLPLLLDNKIRHTTSSNI